jgi:hypothetical protein
LFIRSLRSEAGISLEFLLRKRHLHRPGQQDEAREKMLDILMLALVAAAFAAAAAYAGLCNRLGRRPDMPDEDRK